MSDKSLLDLEFKANGNLSKQIPKQTNQTNERTVYSV